MLKIAKVSMAAFFVALILTLPCWAEPTVDELYGKKFGTNLAKGLAGDLITGLFVRCAHQYSISRSIDEHKAQSATNTQAEV